MSWCKVAPGEETLEAIRGAKEGFELDQLSTWDRQITLLVDVNAHRSLDGAIIAGEVKGNGAYWVGLVDIPFPKFAGVRKSLSGFVRIENWEGGKTKP